MAPQLVDSDGISNKLASEGELITQPLEDPSEVTTPDLQHLRELLDSKRQSLQTHSEQTRAGKEEVTRPDGRALLGYDDLDVQSAAPGTG